MKKYLTVSEVCQILQISRFTLYAWNVQKRIRYFKPSKIALYLLSDIEKYIEDSCIDSQEITETKAIDSLLKDEDGVL